MLGAMRTVGVSEAVYWASWLVFRNPPLFLSSIDDNDGYYVWGRFSIFYIYRSLEFCFPFFYVYGMAMVASRSCSQRASKPQNGSQSVVEYLSWVCWP